MPEDDPIDRWPDERILREASRGNEKAYSVFCKRSLPSLYRYVKSQCRRYGIPKDLARDFSHDAVIRALQFIRSCELGANRPLPQVSEAWLAQIAVNVMLDWGRRERKFVVVERIEIEARPEVSPEEAQETEELLKFFNWLPARERDMLELVYVENKSIIEAGAQLNLSNDNSYKVHQRALELLRDLLAEHGEFPEGSTME